MSEKGPFAEAIRVLCSYRNEYAQKTSPLCAFLDNQGITDAIRVLEAAGKVDKANALSGLEALRALMSREFFMDVGPTFKAVLVLIESLPDKGKSQGDHIPMKRLGRPEELAAGSGYDARRASWNSGHPSSRRCTDS